MTQDNTSNNLPTNNEQQLSLEDAFIQNLFAGMKPKEAAIAAGYSESSASSTIYTKKKNPKFIRKLQHYAISHGSLTAIPKLMKLDNQVIKEYEQDISKAIDKPGALKLLNEKYGLVKSNDQSPNQQFIQINLNQGVMRQLTQERVQEAQIED